MRESGDPKGRPYIGDFQPEGEFVVPAKPQSSTERGEAQSKTIGLRAGANVWFARELTGLQRQWVQV